jgi:PAS domain S-box-containing protein
MADPLLTPLRILLVEDSLDDELLLREQLRASGLVVTLQRVETAADLKTALLAAPWHAVISDFHLPAFDASEALAILREANVDIPFIVVSGSIGEETAVELMRAGAHDYVLKQNLARLIPALRRELREAEGRRLSRSILHENRRLEDERTGLLERLEQENEDLNALTQITANAISTLELDELVRVLLERIVEFMRADAVTMLLADGRELKVFASAGAAHLSDSVAVKTVGEGFEGMVAATMKAVYIEDATADSRVTDPLIRERGLHSFIGVPLKRHGNLIGVLHAGWLTTRPRRDRDVQLLEITADRCAAAIQNSRLYEDLRASEERFRMLAETIAEVFWMTDASREELIYISPGYESVWGRTCESLLAAPSAWLEAVHPEDREAVADSLRHQAQGGYDIEYRIVRPDGAVRHIHDRAFAATGTDGHVFRVVGVARDVTERWRAQEALRSSLRDKDALLKEVHHRVKNNLQVITSLLRLEAVRNSDGAAKRVLKDMQGRIQSMALLHETLYRSGSFAAVDLGSYLSGLSQQLVRTLRVQGGAVEFKPNLESVMVGIDQAIPCGLLVHELVSNCMKHAFPNNADGTIGIELRREGSESITLSVWDTGVGLPQDFSTRQSQSLGLQLVSDLARQLSGRLEVMPGPGATFSVTFKFEESVPILDTAALIRPNVAPELEP